MSARPPASPALDRRQYSGFSTCAIANAIEVLDARLRNEGFGNSTIHCRFPHFSPVIKVSPVTFDSVQLNPPDGRKIAIPIQTKLIWD